MPLIDEATPPAETTLIETPVATTAAATEVEPTNPMDNAADVLFGDKTKETGDKPAAEEPAKVETEEEKAARLAAETPEEKAAREAKEAEEAKNKAPENYEDFKLPEGVKLDEAATNDFKTLAKDMNLSQENAQKLVDIATGMSQRWSEEVTKQADGVKAGWREAAKSDKEFGGDKLPATLALAQKAVKQFGDPELTELLVGAGLGDHPAVIRFAARAGKALSEAPIVTGGKPGRSTPESVLYPNLK
jgi:hypothetical protein